MVRAGVGAVWMIWDDLVDAMLRLGSVAEASSRYGDKPALVMSGREIAHMDDDAIDVRITSSCG